MFDYDGSAGVAALSTQLAMYRTLDALDRRRANQAAFRNEVAWRNQCDNLARERDNATRQYNQLLKDANAYANTADQHIAWQAKQIADLQAENEALRLRAEAAEGDLAILDVFVRETRPEASGLHYD